MVRFDEPFYGSSDLSSDPEFPTRPGSLAGQRRFAAGSSSSAIPIEHLPLRELGDCDSEVAAHLHSIEAGWKRLQAFWVFEMSPLGKR